MLRINFTGGDKPPLVGDVENPCLCLIVTGLGFVTNFLFFAIPPDIFIKTMLRLKFYPDVNLN